MAAYPLRAAFAGVLLFVLGLGLASATYQINRREMDRRDGWVSADGTVVELLRRRTIEGEMLVPLVAFTAASGERVSFTGNPRRESPYYINAPVKVLYRPGDPQAAQVDPGGRFTRTALAGAGALILMVLGGYVAWYASRWDKAGATDPD
jgi:hypothetical protein